MSSPFIPIAPDNINSVKEEQSQPQPYSFKSESERISASPLLQNILYIPDSMQRPPLKLLRSPEFPFHRTGETGRKFLNNFIQFFFGNKWFLFHQFFSPFVSSITFISFAIASLKISTKLRWPVYRQVFPDRSPYSPLRTKEESTIIPTCPFLSPAR